MYSIRIETNFRAYHQLILPNGDKEPRHEHQWQVVTCISGKINNMGLVMDFEHLKHMVVSVTVGISGDQLQKNEYFKEKNSSAEMVAEYIYNRLEPQLPKNLSLDYIEVFEQPGCSAKFSR